MEYKPMFVEKLPIPKISKEAQSLFANLAKAIIKNKKNGVDISFLEDEIDDKVCQLYDLSTAEKQIIFSY